MSVFFNIIFVNSALFLKEKLLVELFRDNYDLISQKTLKFFFLKFIVPNLIVCIKLKTIELFPGWLKIFMQGCLIWKKTWTKIFAKLFCFIFIILLFILFALLQNYFAMSFSLSDERWITYNYQWPSIDLLRRKLLYFFLFFKSLYSSLQNNYFTYFI